MNKNWTAFLEYTLQPPKTVVEAVDRLLEILDGWEKLMIALMQEDELIDLRFGLGLAVRNAFGLNDPGSKLLAACGTSHPDDASDVIIKTLWRNLSAL